MFRWPSKIIDKMESHSETYFIEGKTKIGLNRESGNWPVGKPSFHAFVRNGPPRDRDNFRFRTPRTLVIKISYLEYPLSDLPLASAHPICTIMRISLCALCNLDCRSLREFFMGRCIIQRESLFHAHSRAPAMPTTDFSSNLSYDNENAKRWETFRYVRSDEIPAQRIETRIPRVSSRKEYFKFFHPRL